METGVLFVKGHRIIGFMARKRLGMMQKRKERKEESRL